MKRGFTLAEVLITLGIIGVIAALTIPALITKYQKRQTAVALKQAYIYNPSRICPEDMRRSDILGTTVNPNLSSVINVACNKTKSGSACSALIMMDGWEIKDDYPWF